MVALTDFCLLEINSPTAVVGSNHEMWNVWRERTAPAVKVTQLSKSSQAPDTALPSGFPRVWLFEAD